MNILEVNIKGPVLPFTRLPALSVLSLAHALTSVGESMAGLESGRLHFSEASSSSHPAPTLVE